MSPFRQISRAGARSHRPIAAAAQARPPGRIVGSGRCFFVLLDGLPYRRSSSGDHSCIPAAGELSRTVLMELNATPLGGHFGRDKTPALARRCGLWQGLPAAVDDFMDLKTCATFQPERVKADLAGPSGASRPGLLFPLRSRRGGAGASASTFWSCRPPALVTTSCRTSAGAHRPPDGPRLARPHLQGRHFGNCGA